MELQTMPLRFRVWDKKHKCFLPPSQFAIDGDGYLFFWDDIRLSENGTYTFREATNEEYKRFIISQDTGLKDESGKNIYTGDIIYYKPYNRYVPALYRDGMVVIRIRWGEEYYISNHLDDIEVVGNIWQNPELLEYNGE